MFRALSILSAVTAAGLLGWAGYTALRGPSDDTAPTVAPGGAADRQADPVRGGLVVENPEQDLGELPPGEYRVGFRVTNRSDHPGEVVGGTSGCRPGCCFDLREGVRQPVPPGGSVEVVGELDVRKPGPFEFEGELYLDDGGQLRAVRFKLTGVGVQPKGKPDAPPR